MDQRDNDNPPPGQELVDHIGRGLYYSLDTSLHSDEKRSWTIDPVPRNWREVHNNAFDPEMITIGPFTRREVPGIYQRVRVMEEHKARFLNRFLGRKLERRTRVGGDMSGTTEGERPSNDRKREEDDGGGQMAKAVCLEDLEKAMMGLEVQTWDCYPKSLKDDWYVLYLSTGSLTDRMVIDSYFVVELLRLYYHHLHSESTGGMPIEDDPIFANPRILATLRRDLLLLENQLPFFVLEKMYELIKKMNGIDHAVPLEDLAVTFFDPLLPQPDAVRNLHKGKTETLHLLQIFHSTFLQSVRKKQKKGKSRVKSRSKPNSSIAGLVSHFASELQEAGVKFEKRKHHDLLDIEVDHRTLRVPPLSINDHTISLLLNFVAFELSVNHPQPVFTNYLMFWNSLINSTGDVRILHKHGIINHLKGDEDVAKLFMKCREVIFDQGLGYLYDDIKEVNDYCVRYSESNSLFWWRSLIRERFSSPWTCLSLFAAIILLLLTLLQTFYTVYPYYRPR